MTIDEALHYMDRIKAGTIHPQCLSAKAAKKALAEDYDRVRKERDESLAEVTRLRGLVGELRAAGDAIADQLRLSGVYDDEVQMWDAVAGRAAGEVKQSES